MLIVKDAGRKAVRFVGVTGGVGAGKTEVLGFLAKQPGCRVMLADEIAHELMEPGNEVYRKLCAEFAGEDIFAEEDTAGEAERPFDRGKLAQVIFGDEEKRKRLNGIVHPAVKDYVIQQAESERERGQLSLLVLEAALLIEEHYDEICDELWYIYTSEEVRRQRLIASRGYSDAKIDQIFASQLKEDTYRKYCKVVIDNNGDWDITRKQLEKALRRKADE